MGELNILISLIAAEGSGMCSPGGARTGHLYMETLHLSGFRQHPKLCWMLLALFLQKHSLWASPLVPGAAAAAAWDTQGGEELKSRHEVGNRTGMQKYQDAGKLHRCCCTWRFFLSISHFFFSMKCNYANEGALIIIHLQHPWRLLGARGSSPAGSSRDPLAGRAQGGTAPPGEPVLLGIWMNKNH